MSGSGSSRNCRREARRRAEDPKEFHSRASPERVRRAFALLTRTYHGRRLIHLSTFLGHVDPDSTAVYLTITEDLLLEADNRSRALVSRAVSHDFQCSGPLLPYRILPQIPNH